MTDNPPDDQGENEDDVYVIDEADLDRDGLQQITNESARAEGTPDDSSDVAKLREENEKLRNETLRSRADFENFRKRTEREKQDYYRHSLSRILTDLLPVLDNFERALASAPSEGDDFTRGVELIYKQLADSLEKYGLKPIDQKDQPFDPKIHEAVIRDDDPDVPSHTVTEVLQKGYSLNDRLLRPAMVRVAVGGPERAGNE